MKPLYAFLLTFTVACLVPLIGARISRVKLDEDGLAGVIFVAFILAAFIALFCS